MCPTTGLIKLIDMHLIQVCLIFKVWNMALSFLLVLAATVILIRPETPVTKVQNGRDSRQRANVCSAHVTLIC